MTDTKDRGVAAVSPSERAKACAAEVLKNGAMRFSQPDFFRPEKPQAEIDWAISMGGHIIETFFPAAPAVPPQPTPVGARDGWIPVSERLPQMNTDVLIFAVSTDSVEAAYFKTVGSARIWKYWGGGYHETDVTHWRPLPAPPNADPAADSRAPAEVLEALKRDVIAEVRTYGIRAGTNIATSLEAVTRRINKLFDAAVKEPTK